MKSRLLLTGFFLGLLDAASAQAAPVAWLFEGTLTSASGAGLQGGIAAGDSFSFILHFDS